MKSKGKNCEQNVWKIFFSDAIDKLYLKHKNNSNFMNFEIDGNETNNFPNFHKMLLKFLQPDSSKSHSKDY